MPNRRTGKVARLPKVLRDQVNAMLRDGATYNAIIVKLQQAGHADLNAVFNEQNLSNWKEGGYQDWLTEQERLADMSSKREFALEIVRQNEGSKLHEASLHLAASQIYEALSEFDLSALKDLLAEKPENYAKVVGAISKLNERSLDLEKFKAAVRERDERIQKELDSAKGKGGLTAETIEKIERELKLI